VLAVLTAGCAVDDAPGMRPFSLRVQEAATPADAPPLSADLLERLRNAYVRVIIRTPAPAKARLFVTLSAHVSAVSGSLTTGTPYASQNFVA